MSAPTRLQNLISVTLMLCLGFAGHVAAQLPGAPPEITVAVSDGQDTIVLRPQLHRVVGRSGSPEWQLDRPLEARVEGRTLGRIDFMSLMAPGDPVVSISFTVTAGAAPTTFILTSPNTNFSAIANPWAFATASVGATDTNGDGATVTGQQTGGAMFEALYNLMTPVVWAALVTNPLTAPADGTNSVSQRQPTEGRQVIGASVTDIQVVFGFQLSPLDWANGSSAFSLIQPPTTITATAGTPQSTAVSTAFPVQLQATLLDGGANPVQDVVVTFTAPGSGASGTFPSGNTAVTDATGRASVPFTANAVTGAYQVTANISPALAVPAIFELTNTAGPPGLITATGGTPQSAPVLMTFPQVLEATVTDASFNPVPGELVTFVAPATGPSCTFPAGNTALTDTNGQASVQVAANHEPGAYTVAASVDGVPDEALFELENFSAPIPLLGGTGLVILLLLFAGSGMFLAARVG